MYEKIRASLIAQLVKNLPAMQETWVQSLGLDRSPEEVKGYPLQYSGLENSMNCIAHGARHDFHFHTSIGREKRGVGT